MANGDELLQARVAATRFQEFLNPYRLLLVTVATALLAVLLSLRDPSRILSAVPAALALLGLAPLFCAATVHELNRFERQLERQKGSEAGADVPRGLAALRGNLTNRLHTGLLTSGTLSLGVLGLTFLTGRNPTGRNDISASFVPHGLCLLVASLAAGTLLDHKWALQRVTHPDGPTPVLFDPKA
jgi:hypothetical protein